MIFEINFNSVPSGENIVCYDCDSYGLKDLYDIRATFPKYKIDHENIAYGCISSYRCHRIRLTEEQATKCLVFYDKNEITVHIPKHSLNKYIIHEYEPIFHTTTFCKIPIKKTIKHVSVNYKLDIDRIINDWSSHGCPLIWNPNSVDGTCSPELIKIYENMNDKDDY